MSRSKRLPIIKDKPRNYKRTAAYWRPIRSRINQIIRNYSKIYDDSIYDSDDPTIFDLDTNITDSTSIMLGTDIPDPKTVIKDWNYCDNIWDYRINPITNNSRIKKIWEEIRIKYSRK